MPPFMAGSIRTQDTQACKQFQNLKLMLKKLDTEFKNMGHQFQIEEYVSNFLTYFFFCTFEKYVNLVKTDLCILIKGSSGLAAILTVFKCRTTKQFSIADI